jgi:outer membrane protein
MRPPARARLLRAALIACFAIAPLSIAAPRTAHAQALAVVYVDVERVIIDCDEGKEADELLRKEQAAREKEIRARETELKKMQDDLEKQSRVLSAAALEKKFAAFQQYQYDYQRLLLKTQNELDEKRRELVGPIERKLSEMLRAIALRDGYDLILNKRGVPYGRKDLDLTEKVTQEYNKANPVAKKAEKADPKAPAKKPSPAKP